MTPSRSAIRVSRQPGSATPPCWSTRFASPVRSLCGAPPSSPLFHILQRPIRQAPQSRGRRSAPRDRWRCGGYFSWTMRTGLGPTRSSFRIGKGTDHETVESCPVGVESILLHYPRRQVSCVPHPVRPNPRKPFDSHGATEGRQGRQGLMSGITPQRYLLVQWSW
jgi:hypothetical protein